MMKKKIFYGMIALLSVSLFFLGCPTDTSDDTSSIGTPTWPETGNTNTPPSTAQAAANLAAVLTASAPAGVTVTPNANGSVTITGGILPISDSLKIDSGVKIVVETGATLAVTGSITNDGTIEVADGGKYTLAAGATVTNNGTITVNDTDGSTPVFTVAANGTINNAGTIEVTGKGKTSLAADAAVTNTGTIVIGPEAKFAATDGEITNAGTITVNGEYTLDNDTEGTNDGTIIIGPNATAKIGSDVRFEGSGIVIVESGGKVSFNGGTDYFIGDASALFHVLSGKFHFNNTSLIVDGSVTLKSPFNNVGAQVLLIKANSMLTLEAALSVTGKFDAGEDTESFAVVGELGSSPSVPAKIVFSGGSIVVTSATSNFYNSSGAPTPPTHDTGNLSAGPYNWVADADGSNNAGWSR
ncbi:hypothetical protein LQZ21_04470 [Treponema sp. TIM-1]|uniref:hypothetical protein n=1 Tax=Treponema sp. TIM-1 TaxID=2898417 RepID=UPI00398162D2